MALNGIVVTTDYNGRFYWLEWTATQSVANNTSTISWAIKCDGGSADWYAERTLEAVIDGKVVFSKETRVERYAGTVATGTVTLGHDTLGAKTFSISMKVAIYGTTPRYTGSGTFTLDTIARASQPSLVTWPETTNNVGNFGTEFAIHMNRASSVFTHTVRYEYGNRTGTIATNVGTGTTWAVPLAFMNDIPNATSASGRIYVDTYNGSTFIGTKYTGFTVTVPTSVKPTCRLTLEDTTGVDDIYGSPVQGLSKIKITVTGTPAYSSPIDSYSINANGVNYLSATADTGILPTAGDIPVNATVKDKRGRSGSASYTMKVQAYAPPTITSLTVHRCDEDGTENEQGEYVRVQFDAAITSLNSKNTAVYTLRYKKSGATSWTSQYILNLTNTYTVKGGSVIFAADGNSSYDVEIIAEDSHDSVTRATSASTAFTLMNWGANGTSMALGKVAEEANAFEVALNNHFYGATQQEGNRYAFSSPGVAGSVGFVLMAQVEITAANADTPITFVFSRRQAVAPMTVHLRLSNSTATTSTLASIRYEGENYDAYAYQFNPLTWHIYVLKGSNYDTITLQDWYTSKAMDSRVKVSFPGDLVNTVPTPYYKATPAQLDSLLDYIYPVGSIYLSYSHNNPATMFGGTWVRIENAFLWAVGADGTIGQKGGEAEHTLTIAEMPSHSHGSVYSQHATGTKDKAWYTTTGSSVAYGAVATGGGAAHNNMPPYIQISAWRRTA